MSTVYENVALAHNQYQLPGNQLNTAFTLQSNRKGNMRQKPKRRWTSMCQRFRENQLNNLIVRYFRGTTQGGNGVKTSAESAEPTDCQDCGGTTYPPGFCVVWTGDDAIDKHLYDAAEADYYWWLEVAASIPSAHWQPSDLKTDEQRQVLRHILRGWAGDA